MFFGSNNDGDEDEDNDFIGVEIHLDVEASKYSGEHNDDVNAIVCAKPYGKQIKLSKW